MLVVDNLKHIIRDDNAVTGSETIFHPAGEVQSLLHHDLRIRAELLRLFHLFHYIGAVSFSAVLHFLIVVVKVLRRIFNIPSKCLFYKIGTELMTVCSLLCIGTCPLIHTFAGFR